MTHTVIAIDYARNMAITEEGHDATIIQWFDKDMNETEPLRARTCVAVLGDKFLAIDLSCFVDAKGN